MNIHFYLNNDEETVITSMYDLSSNPFNLNDIIYLDVSELHLTTSGNKNYMENVQKNQKELKDIFSRRKVRLCKEGKYMKFNIMDKTKLVIEYHCEFVD